MLGDLTSAKKRSWARHRVGLPVSGAPNPYRSWLVVQGSRPRLHEEVRMINSAPSSPPWPLGWPALRERIGGSSRNSSKPHLSVNAGPAAQKHFGLQPPDRRKGSGRNHASKPVDPDAGPELWDHCREKVRSVGIIEEVNLRFSTLLKKYASASRFLGYVATSALQLKGCKKRY